MPVTELRIENYRSIRHMILPLAPVNLILGPNGCGKTNLYNSIALIRSIAKGDLAAALAVEGGMPSAIWAGAKPTGNHISLGVTIDDLARIIHEGC